MFSGITNYFETLVFARIRHLSFETDLHLDEEQLEDVVCVALNRLPPRYYRHSVDLATHLSLDERDRLESEVAGAVDFGLNLVRSRRSER